MSGFLRIYSLTKNFRNTGKIALLAQEINMLQKNYTDFKYKSDQTAPFHFRRNAKAVNRYGRERVIPDAESLWSV